MLHRLRKTFAAEAGPFAGPVEGDEPYMGGTRKTMPKARGKALTGRGAVGQTAVVGAGDRATKAITARVIKQTGTPPLHGFVARQTC